MEYLITAAVLGGAYLLLHAIWRRDARRVIDEWCKQNEVTLEDADRIEFYMGRPADARIVGTQAGVRYRYLFTLHSSFMNMPNSLLRVWGKVKLREKYPVE